VAGNIVVAWLLTLPAAAAIGATVYGVSSLFGEGAAGPLAVTAAILLGVTAIMGRRMQQLSARGAAQAASSPTAGGK
jgi:PiT family inorganic phosphate transporter